MITAAAVGFLVALLLVYVGNPLFDWWGRWSNEWSLRRFRKKNRL